MLQAHASSANNGLVLPDCMTDLLAPTTFSPPRVRLPHPRVTNNNLNS